MMDKTGELIAPREASVKIIHLPNADFIHDPKLPEVEVQKLIEEFGNGLPEGYVAHPMRNLYMDSQENPRFFVKKRFFGEREIERMRTEGSYYNFTPQELNSLTSLASEFQMAGMVESILTTDEARDFARGYGYEGIGLVKPLAGIITTQDREKFMVYPYVAGIPWHLKGEGVRAADRDKVGPLWELFVNNGIKPSDLCPKQILICGNQMRLIDFEAYNKIN